MYFEKVKKVSLNIIPDVINNNSKSDVLNALEKGLAWDVSRYLEHFVPPKPIMPIESF